jgi:hypothetical protein
MIAKDHAQKTKAVLTSAENSPFAQGLQSLPAAQFAPQGRTAVLGFVKISDRRGDVDMSKLLRTITIDAPIAFAESREREFDRHQYRCLFRCADVLMANPTGGSDAHCCLGAFDDRHGFDAGAGSGTDL